MRQLREKFIWQLLVRQHSRIDQLQDGWGENEPGWAQDEDQESCRASWSPESCVRLPCQQRLHHEGVLDQRIFSGQQWQVFFEISLWTTLVFSSFYQFVEKHRDEREWTDDIGIMTSVRIIIWSFVSHHDQWKNTDLWLISAFKLCYYSKCVWRQRQYGWDAFYTLWAPVAKSQIAQDSQGRRRESLNNKYLQPIWG